MNTFRWKTHDGREVAPITMATAHVFNALKMLWNNIVDPIDRVVDDEHPFKRWWDVRYWQPAYVRQAAYELTQELIIRGPTECEDVQELFLQLIRAAQSNLRGFYFEDQVVPQRAVTIGILLAVGAWTSFEVENNEKSMHRVRGKGKVRKSNVRRSVPKSKSVRTKSRNRNVAGNKGRRKAAVSRKRVGVRRRVRS